jgi:tetratricopeptide (TPR) repeat protein
MAEAAESEPAEEIEPAFDTGAAAVAAALDEARADPSLRGHVEAFFKAQEKLVEAQTHHLHVQLRQVHLRTVIDFAKMTLQLVSVAVVLALAVGIGLILRDAMNDNGLVIESFSAPPDLAARGLTGQALAEDLAGRIAAIRRQANANSVTVSDDVRSGGADALKVEIPQTGLSLDEVDRFLHAQLGHAKRLSGEVTSESGGKIAIDLHLSQADPIHVEGAAGDLDHLMQGAAEQAFAAFDPVNTVLYLRSLGRDEDALAAAQRNVQAAQTPFELTNALSLYGNGMGDRRRALSLARLAFETDPKLWDGWSEAAAASRDLGHDEDAVKYDRLLLMVKVRDQWRNHRAYLPYLFNSARMAIDRRLGDYAALSKDAQTVVLPDRVTLSDRFLIRAEAAAGRHDCDAADHAAFLDGSVALLSPEDAGDARLLVAGCRRDAAGGLSAAETLRAADEQALAKAPKNTAAYLMSKIETLDRPRSALMRARTGDIAGAEALIAQTPLDCYLCLRTRGQAAALKQDWPAADRWFGEAVRQAPSLPFAYSEWGDAKAAKGDLEGAVSLYRTAHQKSPHFPDALKGWGDALARQGRFGAARSAYDQALREAPAWRDLRRARDAATPRATLSGH